MKLIKQIIKKIRQLFNGMDKPLLGLTLLLIILGSLNIVTASSREAVGLEVSMYHYFYRQVAIVFLALILSGFILIFPTKKYPPLAKMLFVVIGAILIGLYVYGTGHRGAKNWVNIFGFTFQPSEFCKPIVIVCLSLFFEKYAKLFRNPKVNHYTYIGYSLLIGFTFAGIIFLEKDFGTMFILAVTAGTIFLASPILRKEKAQVIGFFGIVGLVFLCIINIFNIKVLSDAQLARFEFFNPCSRYETGGYQICNGYIAINDGGLFGLGIGKSKQKYSYIPEPHTDSVFAIFVEEWGLISATLIFILYIAVLFRILKISTLAKTIRGRLISLGVATYMFLHILVNLGGLFGIMPLTGVPLPFLSYGGSFTISLICSLAVVQRIHIETKQEKLKI